MTIYVLDDDNEIFNNIDYILNSDGVFFERKLFTSTSKCENAIKENEPNFLLINIDCLKGKGFFFAKKISGLFENIKILVISKNEIMAKESINFAAKGFLLNPFTIENLKCFISNFLIQN